MSSSTDIEQIIARLPAEFSSRIYYLALRKLRSASSAEDVRNETLLRVIQALRAGSLRAPEALPAFVLSIARNVILEEFRKQNRTGELGDRDFPNGAPEEPADPAVRRAIESALTRLKPRERDVLRLAYFEDLSKEEISERLGIVPDRVRLVKSRALKSFREFYWRVTGAKQK
ncbi:MAG: sigma-70 family RNA polymerase sigma factor [Acidobacteria bacterium]|nr:sigma-70 family RNA polymerase sigma factor [Acidobacteriota bacterium]